MPRPQDDRIVHEPPLFRDFKPVGARGQDLERVLLTLDEFEAVRLADYEGLSHAEAAEEMEISRSTFSRLVEKARKKICALIIQGKYLSIEGGSIHFRNNIIHCQECGHMFRTNIRSNVATCPVCGSNQLVNLAGGFGHGRCCHYSNHKKGGKHARR